MGCTWPGKFSLQHLKGSCAKNYCHPNPQLHQTQTRSRISFKEFKNWLQLHLCRNEGQGVSNASNVFTTDGLHTTSASNGINAMQPRLSSGLPVSSSRQIKRNIHTNQTEYSHKSNRIFKQTKSNIRTNQTEYSNKLKAIFEQIKLIIQTEAQ